MINNDPIESLSISSGSSCSYNSSTGSSLSSTSSNSSTTSSCSSKMSSTPTNSNISSLSLSPSKFKSQAHKQQVLINNQITSQKYDQIVYDFNGIMGDLTSVCGTLNILAKQIDQIVHKIDDRFGIILSDLNAQQRALASAHMNNISKNDGANTHSEVVKDYKKLNDVNMTLIENTVKQNTKNYENIDQLKRLTRTINNNCIYSTVNQIGITKSSGGDENLPHQTTKQQNHADNNVKLLQQSAVKTSCSKINSENVLMNMMQSDNAKVLNYESFGSVQNNTTGRSASERKVCSKNGNEKSDSYHRFNTLNSLENADKPLNKSRNRAEFWSPVNISSGINRNTNTHQTYEALDKPVLISSSTHYRSQIETNSNNSLRRCTRSKSQPAFNKEQNAQSEILQQKNVCPIVNNTLNYNLPSNSSNNFAQSSMFDFKTKHENVSLKNNQGNAESSFYEDQLDNELESMSLPSRSHSKLDSPDLESLDKPDDLVSTSTTPLARKIGFNDDSLNNTNSLQNKSNKTKNSKSANSNHHVSFNINNAIYSTRQEIPISIIKCTNQNQGSNTGANAKQPVQSSLKKSTTSSAIQTDQQKNGIFYANSNGRNSDTKTTIL